LGDLVVLALKASEVASHRSHGERLGSGKEMKKRLFFNRVHMHRDRTTKNQGVKLPLPILPHSTDPPLRRRYGTSMVAKGALHLPFLQRVI